MTPRKHRQSQSGFTLVELAIVITIIGLIIGGVVQGQKLIDTARLQSVMREVEQFKSPAFTFLDKYQALPGDMLDDTSNDLLGVDGGDGNGVIGGLYTDIFGAVSANSSDANENRMFWNHLSASGVLTLTRSYPGTQVNQTANMEFGLMFPRSRIPGAGFTSFRYTANEGSDTAKTAYWARLHRSPTGEATASLSPAQVSELDRKFDDGKADSGSIRAGEDNVAGASTCLDSTSDSGYDDRNTTEDCIVIFELF
jgi:prepilin-type N-terminal cleavage/methylation domain-containing protein